MPGCTVGALVGGWCGRGLGVIREPVHGRLCVALPAEGDAVWREAVKMQVPVPSPTQYS